MDYWPSGGKVCHVQPVTDVSIIGGGLKGESYATLIEAGTVISRFVADGRRITIPLSDLANALQRQLTIKLIVDGVLSDGYVLYLPRTESVAFDIAHGIGSDGNEIGGATFCSTDYIDVRNVRELVVSGEQPAGLSVLYGYDGDKLPMLRILPNGTFDNYHLVPSGDYVYIRASSKLSAAHSLLLYYRDRRRA